MSKATTSDATIIDLDVQVMQLDKQIHDFRQSLLRQELKDTSVFKKCRRQKARLLTLATAQTKATQG